MAVAQSISFNFLAPFYLKKKQHVKSFIRFIFSNEQVLLHSLTYIFCTDDYLHELNVRYLSHDTYTDVITFPYTSQPEPVKADIFISIDRTTANASELTISPFAELLRVMIHGALHLCAYNDKTASQKSAMSKKEDEYMLLFFTHSTWNI